MTANNDISKREVAALLNLAIRTQLNPKNEQTSDNILVRDLITLSSASKRASSLNVSYVEDPYEFIDELDDDYCDEESVLNTSYKEYSAKKKKAIVKPVEDIGESSATDSEDEITVTKRLKDCCYGSQESKASKRLFPESPQRRTKRRRTPSAKVRETEFYVAGSSVDTSIERLADDEKSSSDETCSKSNMRSLSKCSKAIKKKAATVKKATKTVIQATLCVSNELNLRKSNRISNRAPRIG